MLDHFSPGITLTMTTCRRLDYFFRTVDSFYKHCLDSDEISRVIVSDDNSSEEDRLAMLKRYPDFEFVWRTCGHPIGLNLLFSMVDTEYFFHLEDDRPMVRDLDLLDVCIKVMDEASLASFIPGLVIGSRTGELRTLKGRPDVRYYVHKHIDDGRFWSDWNEGNTSWPGFYLAPGMHRTRIVQSIPYKKVPQHERSYALRYHAAGHKVGFCGGPRLFGHLTEISAYKHITYAPR